MSENLPNSEFLEPPQGSAGYVLITGATGLLGQFLMRDLFEKGCRIAAIVRSSKRMSAQQRIESICQRWERESGRPCQRPVVLEGDLSNDSLNLTPADQKWVEQNCSRLIHSAAILQFFGNSREAEPWLTNLNGTANVLKFASQAGIREFHYISTAYVSGLSDETVLESDFDRGQEFRNDYERSKFEAEKLVRASNDFDSTTIYRPAVIVGDSKTGFTSTYHGLFLYLRFAATLVPEQQPDADGIRRTPLRLPISGDEPRNLIPVDWVSRVIAEVFCNQAAHNLTYHLVPEQSATFRQVIDYCYEYFNSTGVEFCEQEQEQEFDNAFAAKFFENVKVYQSYETSDPKFDCSNVKRFCGDIKCPEIDKAMIHRFLDFGIQDRWGKRKPKLPETTSWIEEHQECLRVAMDSIAQSNGFHGPIQVGINLRGGGGGQWRLVADRAGGVEIERGLPDDRRLVLDIDRPEIDDQFDSESPEDAVAAWKEILAPACEANLSEKPVA